VAGSAISFLPAPISAVNDMSLDITKETSSPEYSGQMTLAGKYGNIIFGTTAVVLASLATGGVLPVALTAVGATTIIVAAGYKIAEGCKYLYDHYTHHTEPMALHDTATPPLEITTVGHSYNMYDL
jgi:hypothetical protein